MISNNTQVSYPLIEGSSSSSSAPAPTFAGLTPLESSYILELKKRHPFCQKMPFSIHLLALHNDCVNRIKELAKSSIIVIYPREGKFFVDKEKTGINDLINCQKPFLHAFFFTCTKAIETLYGCNIIKQEDIDIHIRNHQQNIKYAHDVYENAKQFISKRSKTPASKTALDNINEILHLIRKMSASIDMLRICNDYGNLGPSIDSAGEEIDINQETLDKEIGFAKNLLLYLSELSLTVNPGILSEIKECLSTFNLAQKVNHKFNPSDMRDISQITASSLQLSERLNPTVSDPCESFFRFHLVKIQLNLMRSLDKSLKTRKLIKINPEALNFCQTCIRLIPQLFAIYDEATGQHYLPIELEGIFFMKKALNTSFSLFNYCQAMEKVIAIVPIIKESTVLFEKEVLSRIHQGIKSRLNQLPHPISGEMLSTIQNEIDELVSPTFLRLFLLRLLVESVENLLITPGLTHKFQLSSSVSSSELEDQIYELKWDDDLEQLKKQLNVSLIYEEFTAQQALVGTSTSVSHDPPALTTVPQTSHQTLPVEVEDHFSVASTSTETDIESTCSSSATSTSTKTDIESTCSSSAQQTAKPSKRSKRKATKKRSIRPSEPIKAPSYKAEKELQNIFFDLHIKKYRQLEKLLLSCRFVKESTNGSHEKWVHISDGSRAKKVIVPRSSSTIPVGTLQSILKDMNSILDASL